MEALEANKQRKALEKLLLLQRQSPSNLRRETDAQMGTRGGREQIPICWHSLASALNYPKSIESKTDQLVLQIVFDWMLCLGIFDAGVTVFLHVCSVCCQDGLQTILASLSGPSSYRPTIQSRVEEVPTS